MTGSLVAPSSAPIGECHLKRKPEKLLRNTNLSIDKENLIIINFIIDFGPRPRNSPERPRVEGIFFLLSREEGRMEYPLTGRCDHLHLPL